MAKKSVRYVEAEPMLATSIIYATPKDPSWNSGGPEATARGMKPEVGAIAWGNDLAIALTFPSKPTRADVMAEVIDLNVKIEVI